MKSHSGKKEEENTWFNFKPKCLDFICVKIAYKVIDGNKDQEIVESD